MELDFKRLPKVELHLHLDCSLSFEVVQQIDPNISESVYQNEFIAPVGCTGLSDYIERASRGINLMQTKDNLRLVTLDLFRQLKEDNVIYAEIRFAPLLHLKEGLTATEVVKAVNLASEEGIKKYGVEASIILCTLRHYSEEQSMETIKLAEAFRDTLVRGFDIAADEAGYPVDNHIAAFQYAKKKNIPCTAHAGEAKGASSVWETLKYFGPSRIGHGVRCAEDPQLLKYIRKHNIHLEVCPTSNVLTKIFQKIEDHNIDHLFDEQISLSINTDGRAISNVSLEDEYEKLNRVFHWEMNHFKKCNIEALQHAFLPEQKKKKLLSVLLKRFKDS
ncbi:MAG: adenosine deaminase [Balneolaceae bacterium]|nr:MAG: adenosine deaminase [Balneolaceae bacterium]